MDNKLIFLDIDGTLTAPGKNVPPESALCAIRKAQANGHKVFLCTGRNYDMLSPLLVYGFDGIVGSSGGYVEVDGKEIYSCPMTPEQEEKAMQVLADNKIFRTIECKEGSWTDDGLKEFLRAHAQDDGNSELLRWREQLEGSLNIRPMSEYAGQKVYKVVMMTFDYQALLHVKESLDDSFSVCIQEYNGKGICNGELICSEYDKGQAVQRVCDYLGYKISDTFGFGDSMNDLEMIEVVGTSVVMDNGSPSLKAKADYICPAYDKDGLYEAFTHFGLI